MLRTALNLETSEPEANVTQEITRLFYQGCLRSTLFAIPVILMMVHILSASSTHDYLYNWAIGIISVYIIRSIFVATTQKNALNCKNPIYYLNFFRFLTLLCGCTWGLSIFTLSSDDIRYQAFLLMILAGVCSYGSISYGIDKLNFFGFISGILIIPGSQLFTLSSPIFQALALATTSFIMFSLHASMQVAKKLAENIALRYEEQKSKEAIYALAERQRLHIEHTPLAVIEWDTDLNISFWNASATKIFGHDDTVAIGKNSALVATDANPSEIHEILQALTVGNGGHHIRTQNKKANGQIIHCEWFNTVLYNTAGTVTGLASLVQDETAYVRAKEENEILAYYDALTQLPNRRLLTNRLVHALHKSKRNNTVGSVIYIDLDNFKNLNDTQGHNFGDMLLCAVAERLKDVLRDSDTVARFGGDEFVLLIEELGTNAEFAYTACQSIAEKIVEQINLPFQLDHLSYRTTPSIGIALFDQKNDDIDEVLRRADTAMYQSKQNGRNNFHFYDEVIQAKINYRTSLKNILQTALANDQLSLHFQAQVDNNKKIKGAEILLRWTHPDHGKIDPTEFIPMAEESKLIIPIGNWVLLEACHQLAKWGGSALTRDLTLSVNVSAIQFNQTNFIDEVIFAVNASKCNPKHLTIELTESAVVQNFEEVIEKMHAIKAMGISLSMDDFGVGYSSLSVLKRLPLDELKIDRSFMFDLPGNQDSSVITQTIIAMSQSLGLTNIAEGVESEAQADFLSKAGCNNYQGFLFGKPVDIASFEKTLII